MQKFIVLSSRVFCQISVGLRFIRLLQPPNPIDKEVVKTVKQAEIARPAQQAFYCSKIVSQQSIMKGCLSCIVYEFP